jgi:hypothetical protein
MNPEQVIENKTKKAFNRISLNTRISYVVGTSERIISTSHVIRTSEQDLCYILILNFNLLYVYLPTPERPEREHNTSLVAETSERIIFLNSCIPNR